MENTTSYNGKGKVKKKKGSQLDNETFISQPFNFEHRAHVDKENNNLSTSHVDVRDQPLLLPQNPGHTNLDDEPIGDIRKELGEMERRLTKTFQTEIKIALSGIFCALCANKLEENLHVNERANETEVNGQVSNENLPGEYEEVDNSYYYGNRQDTPGDISIALQPHNGEDAKRLPSLSNPIYSISETDTTLPVMAPIENIKLDSNTTRKVIATNRPIPVPRTTTYGSKNASISQRLEVSKSDSSMTVPKEAWSEEQDRSKSCNETTSAKQLRGQLDDPRSNGLPSHIQRVQQSRAPVRKKSKFDERECLSKALQLHVQEIVATVVFTDSELPDVLTAGGVITEDESSAIRTIVYRKDQIRFLLSIIKGRDLHVLNKFLKYVEEHCGSRDLIDKIMSTFEDNKKANITGKSCVLCKVSDQVNIKYVTDKLWSIDVIDDGIYNEVVMCTNPTGSQNDMWDKLICCINNLKGDRLTYAYGALCSTLEENSHYMHLSEAIKNRTDMDLAGELTHSCGYTNIQLLQRLKLGTRSSCDTMTSYSPWSSIRSSARMTHYSFPEDYEGNSLPSRNSEQGKRAPAMDLTKQTATQECHCDEYYLSRKRTILISKERFESTTKMRCYIKDQVQTVKRRPLHIQRDISKWKRHTL